MAAGPSCIVSEMVKTAGEAVGDMITDLINQIIVERVTPAEWELTLHKKLSFPLRLS